MPKDAPESQLSNGTPCVQFARSKEKNHDTKVGIVKNRIYIETKIGFKNELPA
jgi:hypothetical protein